MKYHAPTKAFVITTKQIGGAARNLQYALMKMKEAFNIPLEPHERHGALLSQDHAMIAIIRIAKDLDIDLGGEWPEQIDSREEG